MPSIKDDSTVEGVTPRALRSGTIKVKLHKSIKNKNGETWGQVRDSNGTQTAITSKKQG